MLGGGLSDVPSVLEAHGMYIESGGVYRGALYMYRCSPVNIKGASID